MKKLSGLVAYLGFGILVYALSYGSQLDWSDAWIYLFMAFWPYILIWWFVKWVVIIVVSGLIIYGLWTVWEEYRINKRVERVKRQFDK